MTIRTLTPHITLVDNEIEARTTPFTPARVRDVSFGSQVAYFSHPDMRSFPSYAALAGEVAPVAPPAMPNVAGLRDFGFFALRSPSGAIADIALTLVEADKTEQRLGVGSRALRSGDYALALFWTRRIGTPLVYTYMPQDRVSEEAGIRERSHSAVEVGPWTGSQQSWEALDGAEPLRERWVPLILRYLVRRARGSVDFCEVQVAGRCGSADCTRPLRMRTFFIAAVLGLSVLPAWASAQSDPAAGLPAGAQAIATDIASGDAGRITASLPSSGEVTKTAYPGGGSPVPVAQARDEIAAVVVSSAGQDSRGTHAYSLLATWTPNVNPTRPLLVGSGVGPDGVRRSTAFGVEDVAGTWRIVSYGAVLDLDATFAQWQGQGDLRMASGIPRPPATGNTPNEGAIRIIWWPAWLLIGSGGAAWLWIKGRRLRHAG